MKSVRLVQKKWQIHIQVNESEEKGSRANIRYLVNETWFAGSFSRKTAPLTYLL